MKEQTREVPESLRKAAAEQRLGLYDFLRIGHVKRWHNVNTTREQTVGEHSYMVCLIALDLYSAMIGIDPDNRDSSGKMALLILLRAMFHDAPEVAIGDTPTPAKRLIREATGDPLIFEKMEQALMPELPYVKLPISSPDTDPYIKMADAIEGYAFIYNNGAGTHAQVVASGARRKMEDAVEKFHLQDPTAGWYVAVNCVLTAMGLPYVHRESRISPP